MSLDRLILLLIKMFQTKEQDHNKSFKMILPRFKEMSSIITLKILFIKGEIEMNTAIFLDHL